MSIVESNRQICLQAAEVFVDLACDIDVSVLDEVALAPWTTRSLIGHGARVMCTLITGIEESAEATELLTPGAYYCAVKDEITDENFRITGEEAAARLGEDPRDKLRAKLAEFGEVLDNLDPDADPIVATHAGGMRLSAFLPVCTSELVTHTLDLAHAVNADVMIPADALRQCLAVLSDLAVLTGRGHELLLALSGRQWANPRLNLFA